MAFACKYREKEVRLRKFSENYKEGEDLIEWIPFVLGGAALIQKMTRMSEREKIERTFQNAKFGVKENGEWVYPEFLNKEETESSVCYRFRLPFGLTVDPKLSNVLSKSLNRNVEVEGNSVMNVWIFKQKLPERWFYKDVPSMDGWVVPLGKSYKGLVWHDFDKTPHMTIAGITRFGKTVLLKNMVTYLTEHRPEDVEFYIIDLKGGLEFGRFTNLKQIKCVASNVEESHDMLEILNDEIRRSMNYFKKNRITNIVNSNIRKRKFVIVDEGAELTPDSSDDKAITNAKKYCQKQLSEIARVSGALGYRLIFCTQYPTSDTLPRQIKQNSDAKISFRLPTGYASEVAIDEYGAEKLECPGRAIYKTHERTIVQVPLIEDDEMWERLRRFECEPDQNPEKNETLGKDIIKFG